MSGPGEIAYRLERSSRRRTVGILVDPERGVVVRAPRRVSAEEVAALVAAKAEWVRKQQAALAARGLPPPPRSFADGEPFPFLGRDYELQLSPVPTSALGPVRLEGESLVAPIDRALPRETWPALVRAGLQRWYRRQAAWILPRRVDLFAGALGASPARVVVADQKRRWGSCNAKGELRLNWRIVMAPLRLVDYLAAHELCHLVEPNHSARFWRRLALIMPDYLERRESLGRDGPRWRL